MLCSDIEINKNIPRIPSALLSLLSGSSITHFIILKALEYLIRFVGIYPIKYVYYLYQSATAYVRKDNNWPTNESERHNGSTQPSKLSQCLFFKNTLSVLRDWSVRKFTYRARGSEKFGVYRSVLTSACSGSLIC